MIVTTEPYFDPSFLEAKQEDLTIEGDTNKVTLMQSGGYTYTVELIDNKYVVTSAQK